jgi:hypothetical protein
MGVCHTRVNGCVRSGRITNLNVANEDFVVGSLVGEVGERLRSITFVLTNISEIVVVLAVWAIDKRFNPATGK